MMQHDEVRDLLAAYALGAVSDDERREVDAHLRTCDSCPEELDSLRGPTEALAVGVEPVPMPAGFTDRVLDAAIGSAVESPVEARPRRRWMPAFVVGGAMLLAALIAITATVVESRNDAARERRVVSLLASDDGISLTGESGVIGKVSGDEFALAGVEAAPEGKTYQLWLMRGDGCPSAEESECELVSAGTFDTEDGVALLDLEEDGTDWDDAAVTIEAAGGVDFPTTDPFAHSL